MRDKYHVRVLTCIFHPVSLFNPTRALGEAQRNEYAPPAAKQETGLRSRDKQLIDEYRKSYAAVIGTGKRGH